VSTSKKGPISQLGAFEKPRILVMTLSMFATSLLERTSFRNTTFQPDFLMSFKKTLELFDKEI
jgi:hypothetical protein